MESKTRIEKLNDALNRLKESLKSLNENKNSHLHEIFRDSVIKRFEFTFDLFWKCLKDYLDLKHGIKVASPKSSFRESLTQKLIDKKEFDLLNDMVADRNDTSHDYDETIADAIAEKIEDYYKLMSDIASKLK